MRYPVYDHPRLQLPYTAIAPWPRVLVNGQTDWIESVSQVELWLEQSVGAHWSAWMWNTWTLHQQDLCSVSFRRPQHVTLFLLRWSAT